jgi:hypothetical protein
MANIAQTEVLVEDQMLSDAVIDWRAVFGGAVGAAAIFGIFLAFGSAIGLSMTSARPYAGLSASVIGIVLAIWFAIIHVGSFAAGGYLAGRMRTRAGGASVEERQFRDGAHGFLVWAVGALVTALLVAMSAIGAARTTAEVGAALVNGAASATAAAASATAQNPNASSAVQNVLGYVTDMMLRPSTPAKGATAPATPPPAATPAPGAPSNEVATAEVGRILAVSVANGDISQADRQYLASLIASRTGMSQADSERRVTEVWDRYKSIRAEAETKARDAAETARKSGILAALLAAAVSLAGLAAAVWAAGIGSAHRDENRMVRALGRERFW